MVINLPEDSFVNILSYCTGRGVVKAGEVSEAWLATSRSPTFWEKLDSSSGLTNESKKLNATGLVQLLGRPQLASLTNLTIPYKIKIGKTTMKQIAKACPHLEALDMGYTFNSGINPKDDDLIQAAESFPSLKSMRHDMWSITAYGVGQFARAIGEQLVDLRILGETITRHYLSDFVINIIADACKNLEHFEYKLRTYYYASSLDMLSGEGIKALVEGCRKLGVLELHHAKNVKRDTFVTMLAQDASSNPENSFALRTINLVGYSFKITGWPLRIVDDEVYAIPG